MDAESLKIITSLKTARTALSWTQQDLASRSGVSLVTIARMETGMMSPRLSTLSKLKTALSDAGVRIVDESPAGGFSLYVDPKALVHTVLG